ncbi:Helix-turn-helix domain-containing protein [Chitinophaga costaii]|uniref:Helix-turn-helix domain-containing protein n=1 Tax=Chitinophaga costaii TaxID=1335309 RepID=A0A1C4BB24_9BACT|nr:helix-turn-helix transcriptional regulator [Chitinophaga costaii]PUZ27680.1 AraC family transcriptional regulator [Chitinophaga costaii]SCC04069.1 Helix-turn-helix domain-containing protein [Chitinophaga costaii]
MPNELPHRIKTIREFHDFYGLPEPEHPLISLITLDGSNQVDGFNLVLDFYSISVKRGLNARLRYGQQEYNYNAGIMFFVAPNQVYGKVAINKKETSKVSGWILLIHPDFIWNTPFAKTIKQYEFFDYAVNEALFLSSKEEKIIINLAQNIQQEYAGNIDKFSKKIIISYVEAILNNAERFYNRQFIVREKSNHHILECLEKLLADYFNSKDLTIKGLPTVQHIADQLNVSPKYLSRLLKTITGKSTQQIIHEKLIDKAKEKLSVTNLTVSEIAYELGFEHLQSFSKLFKSKTNQSPLEFRAGFN